MEIDKLFTAAGAAAWGQVNYDDLKPCMTGAAQGRATELLGAAPGGVFIAAFPYYTEEGSGNLSHYAWGRDYHLAVTRRLEAVCDALREERPEYRFMALADNSPVPERPAARLAGIGLAGRNNMVIVPPYGSWVFLGAILTDLPLKTDSHPAPSCVGCSACVKACPTGALRRGDFTVCLSYLTQKKDPLNGWESAAVAEHDLIWGCDRCQAVCPYNREAVETALPEFRQDLLRRLEEEDVSGLSGKAFREKYAERAFTWRGPKPIERNLQLQKKRKKT